MVDWESVIVRIKGIGVDLPDYETFAAALKQADGLSEPSESHGTLVGLLAAAPEENWRDRWLKLCLQADDEGQSGLALPASSQPVLNAVFDGSVAGLADLQMRFQPLLPSDDAPLADRARALGLWCQGFLYGFSMARPGSHEGLPPQVREVLDDFGRLAQVEPPEGEGDERDEVALMEIVEYLRVAAQLVHDELRLATPRPDNDTRH